MADLAQPTGASMAEAQKAAGAEAYGLDADIDFERRLANVYETARRLPPGSDEETQDELGLILQLLPSVERSGDRALLGNIEIAVHSLIAEPPNRLLAIRLREASEQTVLSRSFFRSVLPGSSASTWVIAGMALFLSFAIPVTILLPVYLLSDYSVSVGEVGVEQRLIAVIALAGALGSVISILIRIQDFSEIRILNPPALFWTGFFKPIIGATFALFVFTAFASGLIHVNRAISHGFLFLTLGFIAGFSERFAPDLVSRIESSITSSDDRHSQSPEERHRVR
jgi:hypothetical protein